MSAIASNRGSGQQLQLQLQLQQSQVWDAGCSPLYCMVSKLRPTRFGRRKLFLVKSHVPSPTSIVSES